MNNNKSLTIQNHDVSIRTDKWIRLRDLISKHGLLLNSDSAFTLSTGAQSSYYFDLKSITLNGECLSLIVDILFDHLAYFNPIPVAIGGLTIGADFITAGVALKAHETGHPTTQGSIVRKEPKKHGTRNKIENQLAPGTPIVVVDDVITTGRSIREACVEFIEAGYNIVGIVAIVDRQSGGKESLERDFAPVRSFFTADDFFKLKELEIA